MKEKGEVVHFLYKCVEGLGHQCGGGEGASGD